MARKLNTRLLGLVALFGGVPVAVVVFLVFSGALSTGDPQQLAEDARRLFEKGEYTQAWIAIRTAAKAGGNEDPETMYLMGEIAMKQKPPAVGAAIGAYRAAVALKPDYLEAQRQLAELYVAVRYWREGRAEVKRLKELDPSNGRAYLLGAVVELGQADAEPIQAKKVPYYEAAAASLEAGLERAPDVLDLYRLLAQVYVRLDRAEKVDEVINLALANNPSSPDAYTLKASRLLSLDRTDEAVQVLRAGVEKVGENPKLLVALGETALQRDDIDGAKEYFAKVMAAEPASEAGYLRLASIHRLENERDKAIAVLQQGLEKIPGSANLLAQQADLYLEMGEKPKAAEVIAALEKASPPPGAVEYLKGKEAFSDRQIRQAIMYLEQARDRQHGPQSQLLLARAYLVAGELGSAQTELQNLVSEYPRLIPAWRTLADVQLRLRDFERAARSARVVLERNPDDTEMRMLLAQALLLQQRPADALAEARRAAERAKDDPGPYLLLAEIHLQTGDRAVAESMLRRAVATGKDLARVYEQFLRFYRQTDQNAKAEALLQEAEKALPRDEFLAFSSTPAEVEKELVARTAKDDADPGDLLALSRLYLATDRAEQAKAVYDRILAKAEAGSAVWRQAWQQLFLIEMGEGKYDDAAKLVERMKAVDDQAPELLFAGPLLLLSQNRVEEATGQLQAVCQANPALSHAHFLLGQVLARQERWDEAIAAIRKAIEARPNLIPAHLILGRIYQGRGNYAGALTEANEALRFGPRYVPALEMKAQAHAGLGDWTEALKTREEIARLVPNSTTNLIALAALYLQQHDPKKAEEAFTRAYQGDPDNALLVRAMADFYAETRRPQQGAKIVDDYVERHKTEASAYVVRGEFTAKVAGPAEAEPYYRKAAELDPESPFPFLLLGEQYSQVGLWEKAAAAYAESDKRAAKEDTGPKKRLADVYMLLGKLDEAKAVIDTVLKNAPEDAGALVVAGRIAARRGDDQTARAFIEKALALRPKYGEAKVRLAELYAGPDPMRALEILADVEPADLSFEKAMLLRADINTRRAQLTEAVLDLRRLLDFRPTSVAARMQLASKYMAMKEPGRAAALLQELSRERLDQEAPLLLALGEARLREKKFAEALAAYEKARALVPESEEALVGEVRALVALNRRKEALDRVHHVMNVKDREVWPRKALVALYEETGELDKAFEAIRTGLIANDTWEWGYVQLADMLARAQRRDEARGILLTGLSKVPKSVPVRTALAALEMEAQGSETVVKILKTLVDEFEGRYGTTPDRLAQLRPYMPSVRVYSLALYRLGRVDEALKFGMMLWTLDPTDVANANNMAWIYATEKKNLPRARDMIQRCMRIIPNHPQVLDTAGWIEFLDQRYDEATESLLASIRYGDNADARYHLGRVYEVRQRPDEARAEYQKAIELGLQGKDRADAEQRLKQLAAASS